VEALFLLIPLSVLAALGIGVVLWRAVESGQFDDLDSPAHSILMDQDSPPAPADEARQEL